MGWAQIVFEDVAGDEEGLVAVRLESSTELDLTIPSHAQAHDAADLIIKALKFQIESDKEPNRILTIN